VRTAYVNRGLPGSGKSFRTRRLVEQFMANGLSVVVASSDDYFVCPCCKAYSWYADRLVDAHGWAQRKFESACAAGVDRVVVDNTNVSAQECRPYVQAAVGRGYEVVFLEPETPWAFDLDELARKNTHRVPREALEQMLRRWVPDMTVRKALEVSVYEKVENAHLDEVAAKAAWLRS
jgi:tRNA uridine 5-carbamoylmethylation protein Kti12